MICPIPRFSICPSMTLCTVYCAALMPHFCFSGIIGGMFSHTSIAIAEVIEQVPVINQMAFSIADILKNYDFFTRIINSVDQYSEVWITTFIEGMRMCRFGQAFLGGASAVPCWHFLSLGRQLQKGRTPKKLKYRLKQWCNQWCKNIFAVWNILCWFNSNRNTLFLIHKAVRSLFRGTFTHQRIREILSDYEL